MNRRHRPASGLTAITLASVVVLGACSSGDDDASPDGSVAETAPASTVESDPTTPTPTTQPVSTTAPPTTEGSTTTAPTTEPSASTTPPETTVEPITDAVAIGEVGTTEENDVPVVLEPGAYTLDILEPYAFRTDEQIQVRAAEPEFAMVRDPRGRSRNGQHRCCCCGSTGSCHPHSPQTSRCAT